MTRQITGFVAGVFDLFHVGHLDVLERARRRCDRLVVGVLSDDWAAAEWLVRPMVPLVERLQIVGQLRCVDEVIVAEGLDLDLLEVLGVEVVYAAAVDGVLDFAGLDRLLPPAWTGRLAEIEVTASTTSPILRAALDRGQTRSSVA